LLERWCRNLTDCHQTLSYSVWDIEIILLISNTFTNSVSKLISRLAGTLITTDSVSTRVSFRSCATWSQSTSTLVHIYINTSRPHTMTGQQHSRHYRCYYSQPTDNSCTELWQIITVYANCPQKPLLCKTHDSSNSRHLCILFYILCIFYFKNATNMNFIAAKDWAIRRAKLKSNRHHHSPKNHHPVIYRPDSLPVAQRTMSKHCSIRKIPIFLIILNTVVNVFLGCGQQ